MKHQLLSTIIIFSIILSFSFSFFCINSSASPLEIYVTAPTAGDIFYEMDLISISWYTSESLDYVKIELYKNGDYYSTINENTSNDGHITWLIPHGYSSEFAYFHIRITSLEDGSDYGNSGSFNIYGRSITISSPNPGDSWYKGNSYSINWDSENAGSYVKIQYTFGSTHYTISSSTYNDGYYNWNIPTNIASSSNSRIKITSLSYDVSDYSPTFSIGERSISVTKPNRGDTWFIGGTYQIKWTGENTGSYVKIQYRTSTYSSFRTIVSRTDNDGVYNFTIPTSYSYGSNYQIKVLSTNYPNIYDISERFSIDERYIRIGVPDYGDIWFPNESYTISWDTKNIGNKIDIKLYKNDIYCLTIQENTVNDDFQIWKVPDTLGQSDRYTIEIRSIDYNTVYGISDEFSIQKRTITVISPESNAKLNSNENIIIKWESNYAGNYVKIDLYKDGKFHSTITPRYTNYGTYRWHIPSGLPENSDYEIKITSLDYPDISGLSKGEFLIEKTLLQTLLEPFIFIIIIVTFIIISSIVFWILKKKVLYKKKKEEKKSIKYNTPQEIQIRPVEISPEEYETIWEK